MIASVFLTRICEFPTGAVCDSARGPSTSATPSAAEQTTGRPQAIASSSTLGIPSHREGNTIRSLASRISGTAGCQPAKWIRSATRPFRWPVAADWPLPDRHRPAADRDPGARANRSGAARISRSIPFWSASREMHVMARRPGAMPNRVRSAGATSQAGPHVNPVGNDLQTGPDRFPSAGPRNQPPTG